jgi:hypothetical protein
MREAAMMDFVASPSLVVFGLGAFHGLNPAMGWLFAVALGMQEGGRAGVWRALVPLALGHVLAIAATIAAAAAIGLVLPEASVRGVAGVSLLALGMSRLLHQRHPRWGRMRVGVAGLTFWSFLMASAHGAGLMVLPLVLGSPVVHATLHADHAAPGSTPDGVVATLVHGAGYLLATGLVAVIVYEKTGLGLLRRLWFNVDVVWAAALVTTGMLTVLL